MLASYRDSSKEPFLHVVAAALDDGTKHPKVVPFRSATQPTIFRDEAHQSDPAVTIEYFRPSLSASYSREEVSFPSTDPNTLFETPSVRKS